MGAPEFEAVADLFFRHPKDAIREWERAVDAQSRIMAAVDEALAASLEGKDVAIASHSGVGTLLLCHLKECAMGREHDQPSNNEGNYYTFKIHDRRLYHGWEAIDLV